VSVLFLNLREIGSVRDFGSTVVLTLPYEPLPRRPDDLRRIPSSALRATASVGGDRLPFAFDGDPDSRWLTGASKRREWLQLELTAAATSKMISFNLAERSFGDHPRGLAVDATDDAGTRRYTRDRSFRSLPRHSC
jgi:hypothetical protein